MLVLLGASGCSDNSGRGESAERASARPQKTAWQKVLDQIGPDGEVSLSTALQAFSLRYAPLPGVEVPDGVPEKGLRSGTAALRWITRHWDRLTPQQRKVAQPFADPDGKLSGKTHKRTLSGLSAGQSSRISSKRSAGSSAYSSNDVRPTPGPQVTMDPEDKRATEAIVAWYSDPSRLNRPLDLPYAVVRTSAKPKDPRTAADTQCLDTYGLPKSPLKPTHALIRIYQRPDNGDPDQLRYVLAHEVLHMFQCTMVPTTKTLHDRPAWLVEGSASWAAQKHTGYVDPSEWARYLMAPEKKLFSMSYEALAFFAQLDQSGIDVWSRLEPMLAEQDNERAFAAAGTTERFLDAWAAGYFRDDGLSGDWDIPEGPQGFDRMHRASPQILQVEPDAAKPLEAASYTNRIAYLRSTADIVHITSTDRMRVADSKANDHRGVKDTFFCTKAGGCTCPKGTAGAAAAQLPRLKQDAHLAVTGGTKGVQAMLTGVSLQTFCKKKVGRLACAIPSPGAKTATIAPGRYEGTITYADNRNDTASGIRYRGSGKGPVAFTVDDNGRIGESTFSLNYQIILSSASTGYTAALRITRQPVTGTTSRPVLSWRPRLISTDIPHAEYAMRHLLQVFEAKYDLPLSRMAPTKECDAIGTAYRFVPRGTYTGAFEIAIRARPK